MALPPTGLKAVLYGRDGAAETVFGALDRFDCLSDAALKSPLEAQAFIEKILTDHSAFVAGKSIGWVGPSSVDAVEAALKNSSYLNRRGKALAAEPGPYHGAQPEQYWRVGYLSLALPTAYQLVAKTHRDGLTLPGPPGRFANEETWAWKSTFGQELHLSVWQPSPPGPGGPMKSVHEWSELLAGIPVRVSETSLFMGRSRRVLVSHWQFTSPHAQALLYAEGMEREDFSAVIRLIQLRGNEIAPPVVVKSAPP